jgi:hypothetical protein
MHVRQSLSLHRCEHKHMTFESSGSKVRPHIRHTAYPFFPFMDSSIIEYAISSSIAEQNGQVENLLESYRSPQISQLLTFTSSSRNFSVITISYPAIRLLFPHSYSYTYICGNIQCIFQWFTHWFIDTSHCIFSLVGQYR